MNKFERVSSAEYWNAVQGVLEVPVAEIEKNAFQDEYEGIKLPMRAHCGDAGYDFFSPFSFTIEPMQQLLIPTGIRCLLDEDNVLLVLPRSGLGFLGIQLLNTVGVIDSGYYKSDNEGHIIVGIRNMGVRPVVVDAGQAFAQGIIVKYQLADEQEIAKKRNGGFGSSDGDL